MRLETQLVLRFSCLLHTAIVRPLVVSSRVVLLLKHVVAAQLYIPVVACHVRAASGAAASLPARLVPVTADWLESSIFFLKVVTPLCTMLFPPIIRMACLITFTSISRCDQLSLVRHLRHHDDTGAITTTTIYYKQEMVLIRWLPLVSSSSMQTAISARCCMKLTCMLWGGGNKVEKIHPSATILFMI